jgi:hypothetical protein
VAISAGFYTLYVIRHGDDLRDYYLRRLLVSADNAEQEMDRLWQNVNTNRESSEKIALIPVLESDKEACGKLRPALNGDRGNQAKKEGEGQKTTGKVMTVAGWEGGDAVLCFFDPDSIGSSLALPTESRKAHVRRPGFSLV